MPSNPFPTRRIRQITLPFRQQRKLILAIPVTCLVTSLATFAWLQWNTIKAENLVQHTHEIHLESQRLLTALLEAETGVRGYDITHSKEFIEPLESAIATIPKCLAKLEELVDDNPAQSQRLKAIQELANTRVNLLRQNLRLLNSKSPKSFESSQLASIMLTSKATMDGLRGEINQFIAEAERIKLESDELLKKQQISTWLVVILSAAIGTISSLLAGYLLNRLERRLIESNRNWRETETLYRAVVENFPNGGVFLFDSDLRYLLADGTGLEIVGLTKEELEGKTIWELFPEEIYSVLEPIYREALAGGTITFEIPYADRFYLAHVLPILNEYGKVLAGMLVAQDISDRKISEQHLCKANRALKTISECNQAVVRATDEVTLLQDICRIVIECGGYRCVWICFAEQDEAKTVRSVAQSGYEKGYIESLQITWSDTEEGRGPVGTTIRTAKTHIIQNVLTDPSYFPWRESAIKQDYAATISLPLINAELSDENYCFGALNIYGEEPNAFDEDEVKLLTELANDLAYGIITLRTRIEHQEAEEALRLSEERWQLALRGNNDGIWDWNVRSNEVFFSARWKEMLGFEDDEILNHLDEWAKRVHPDDLGWVMEAIKDHFVGKTPFYITEHRLHCKDGFYKWILARGQALWDDAGNVMRMVGSHTDITEKREAEEALRDSEAKFRAFLESASEAIIVTNPKGEIVVFNAKAEELFGYNRTEVLGQTVEVLIPERYRHHHTNHRAGYQTHPSKRQMSKTKNLFARRKDGSEFPIEAGLSSIQTKDSQFVMTFLLDITERRQTEEEIKRLNESLERRAVESETRYQQIVELAEEGIWVIDAQSRTTYVNHAMTRILGYTESEILGHPISEFMDEGKEIQFNSDVDPGNLSWVEKKELKLKTKNGTPIWTYMSTSPVLDENGHLLWSCSLVYDITKRKQAEEQLRQSSERISLANAELARATRLKDEFLTSMSHELRTPLNAILGLAEALQEEVYGELTQKQRKSMITIENSGKHLLALINDILDLSKIESGKMELQIASVYPESLCESSLTFVKQQAHNKKIHLSSKIEKNIGNIAVDERRIRQVLINLLSNAVKFTPEGGKVDLEVKSNSDEEILQFSVTDTGIGIAAENIARLFKPFVQLDSSLSRRYAGTGLGLALVRRIVELHGGSVSLFSEIGKGSRFTITLPWTKTDTIKQNVREREQNLWELPNIHQALIVEDSEITAKQVARYLGEIGTATTIHPLGEGSVDAALQFKPDVIILDLLLPNISGLEVLSQLKANPATQQIPVLVISVVDERERALSLGASQYLLKPLSRQEFQLALSHIFSQSPQLSAHTALVVTSPTEQKSPLILLAEDNESNISTMMDYLQIHGYRVNLARNGLEAVEMAKEQKPDLILMDIQMPEMDGLEATRWIRKEPDLVQIPIIALTALAMPGDREKCVIAGANEYLTKPVGLKMLMKIITQYIH
ncbi:PAS domain S-box protein [Limnofasciculus baicalensis]|uniref:Circadian input-output histidine kinase CikA n=1 Tax=Limnofasciculus baicalensis BBK-W-15 TaxID=2699891 RepID=A0AAE3GUG4_9CYAN|nr:PAS domain S-box protein [Limnofasciculus baicalensis]MCP2730191.1 PAS domain S-box protein [Limnofasciculus baicalensis BBK-W-15]